MARISYTDFEKGLYADLDLGVWANLRPLYEVDFVAKNGFDDIKPVPSAG